MGDIADYYADLAMDAYYEFNYSIKEESLKSDEELYLYTKKAKDELTIGIRNHFDKYKKLSEKQRYCLARWIVERNQI
jgi:hypothetical protein